MPEPRRHVDVPGGWLLLTAWYFTSVRSMPRMMWRARRLQRSLRTQPGCEHMHRWISRRAILVLTRWGSEAEARAWAASPAYQAFDRRALAIPGTAAVLELRAPLGAAGSAGSAGDAA